MNQTEAKILESAEKVFQEKGFSGARMQEIADRAGVNKSMVHYYFRSKDKLFESIFKNTIDQFMPRALELLNSDAPLGERIADYITTIIDSTVHSPHLPLFILKEINRNPEAIVSDLLLERGIHIDAFIKDLRKQIKGKKSRPNFQMHAFVNIISLTLYPFIAKPLLITLFHLSEEEYSHFIEERKKEITALILKDLGLPK